MHRAELAKPVLVPLDKLGRALRRQVVVQGLCRTVVVALAAALVQLMLDKLLVLGLGPRVAMLAVIVGLVGRELWRGVLSPVTMRIDLNDIAAVLERRHPSLGDQLVSAVAFSTGAGEDPARDSPALIERTIDRARGRLSDIRLDDILRLRRHRRFVALGLGALAVAAAITLLYPGIVRAYIARDLALRDVPWPSRTRLVLEGFSDGRLRWPLGDDFSLVVTAEEEVPRGLRAEFEFASAETASREMARRGQDQFVLDFGPLGQSMKVRFAAWKIGVDEKSDWYYVDAVHRPSIREVRVRIAPPTYAGLEPFSLASGQTSADILRGSRVRIEASLSKPVVASALKCADQTVAEAAPADNEGVVAEFVPAQSGTYYFDLEDADGLHDTNPVTFAIRLVSDTPPKVRFSLPGAGEMVVSGAVLNLAVDCEDNLGLRTVELLSRVVRSGDAPQSPGEPVQAEPLPNLSPGQTRYTIKQLWPLSPLALKPSDRVSLQVRAIDHQPPIDQSFAASMPQDRTAQPTPVGESVPYNLNVVTPEELLAELSRRENEWRREFEQIIKAQEQVNGRILDLKDMAVREEASGSQAVRYGQEERTQRQQAGRLRTVARQFEQVLAELEVNQLATGAVRRRLETGVIVPLRKLIGTDIPAVAGQIERLSNRFDRQLADQLEEAQRELVRAMYAVLANMLKWEGFDEAVGLLRDIIRLQGDLNDETQRSLEREIEALFGQQPTSQPTSQP